MPSMKYKISVIMGIYNCAPTLAEALDSLLNQTYQSFKVIMCDDGSTDNTIEVAKAYANKYDNIVLLRNPHNMGLNYTLNYCLQYADSEYIARMDGDDISLPTRLEKEIHFLDNHPEYAIVSCPMIHFDEKGDFKTGTVRTNFPKKKDFIYGTPFCHAPCLVRREAYLKVGGYSVDKKLLRVEDYHLWMKMYAAGFKGAILNEPLYKMRDDRNAIARRTIRNRINETYVRHIGYNMLKLPWYYQIYAIKPLLVGILPKSIYLYFHRKS